MNSDGSNIFFIAFREHNLFLSLYRLQRSTTNSSKKIYHRTFCQALCSTSNWSPSTPCCHWAACAPSRRHWRTCRELRCRSRTGADLCHETYRLRSHPRRLLLQTKYWYTFFYSFILPHCDKGLPKSFQVFLSRATSIKPTVAVGVYIYSYVGRLTTSS